MTIHLLSALERLREQLDALGAITLSQLQHAIAALSTGDAALARNVLENDAEIDDREVELEEECLKTLALYQPVASDLRYIVIVLKVNNDLERIGDFACNIAARSLDLQGLDPTIRPIDYQLMAAHVSEMLTRCLEALRERNTTLAYEVLAADRRVNQIHVDNFRRIESVVVEDPKNAPRYINLLSVSRYLERIADLAKNISEDVIHLVDGKIIRHSMPTRDR